MAVAHSLGFPRIGRDRELKKAQEAFWKGELDEAGLRIPDDVAVVGYDDVPLAAYVNPPLTTLRTDPIEQGEGAVDLLMARINGEAYERLEESYATELVIRQSCGAHIR